MASIISVSFGGVNHRFQIGNNHGSIHAEFYPPDPSQTLSPWVKNSAGWPWWRWIRSESPLTWVFWVYISNKARFKQSFRDIVDQIKLPGVETLESIFFSLSRVGSGMREKENGFISLIMLMTNFFTYLQWRERTTYRKAPRIP
ncbi:uncharacterized protein N7483_004660 [Penicillium malachiteum]|uniref:uncharacterized protein n=1 Tax=Penicillium malachiteum TaxID=1324776 RepID=UPI00254990C7|nr:uncharacterized protein N7483_004660 [Penicillium malachiteum]KAJ5730152.1 hypothetical protein N7483_004660 [Penicillium malachiteum]